MRSALCAENRNLSILFDKEEKFDRSIIYIPCGKNIIKRYKAKIKTPEQI